MCRFDHYRRRRPESPKSHEYPYYEYGSRNISSNFILYVSIMSKRPGRKIRQGLLFNQLFNFQLSLHFLNFFDHDLQSVNTVSNDSNVGDFENRSILIFIDSYDVIGTCNTGNMLCSTGNTTCNV